MDMSGTMQGAGGVGGLLAVHIHDPHSSIFYPSFDGNGNIVAWTASGAPAPTSLREYDSFGNILIEHGTPPCAIGFSTKIEDPETGLLYYGHRINGLEAGHSDEDRGIVERPYDGIPVPWVGPTPEEAYSR